ncbi:MAG TPA: serine/threonine-protein phosphatase [Chloroflexus aurantiacus]|jgi:serine phosphatase RsbU (regulator of sigma subunit)|uniref:Stage II sporulation E family protein n=2 Tax=Chloroflexus TaxID=1107 RepID=A9WJP2_CHLAA|nr:PP2C family protein-serine/threonine phosphatase [Chloroflexus aurantiacus]ABY35946.1 Stage II sporulation E family protein [Chloroflexus aurantiacus J-10-fl]RMG49422.1 MAG: serine/threonine-protein phosphatase [Chloroflexota bacterium]GIV91543.1 MAG: stage II sporulation protein E [Chloroflexus sp.]HBW69178.1 serine/threonine-protein phosphatase [Chloroflexus aurantiacus]
MKSQDIQSFNELLKQLDIENDQVRLRFTLRMLNILVLTLTVIALLIMLIPPFSLPVAYILVAVSIAINGIIEWLIRINREVVGARLFVGWTNIGVVVFMLINTVRLDDIGMTMFAEITPLFVILSGLLLGWGLAGFVAIVNLVIIFLTYVWYFANSGTTRGVFEEATGLFIPVFLYTALVWAAISFYQYQLTTSRYRLNQARSRLIQDKILHHDLEIARSLQQRLFPPSPPLFGNIRIVAYSEPARETSGDFYDFVQLSDGRWAIVVADVTGKSIAAAMVMVMARSILRSYITTEQSPAAILRAANNALYRDGVGSQYVTVFLGILDSSTNMITFATAGHPFPYLRRNGQIQEIGYGSLPLGARLDREYCETTLQFQTGDQLFLLTDGFYETRNAQRKMFGFEQLMIAIDQSDPADPQRALDHLLAVVSQFRGDAEQDDDMTAIIIQVLA